MLALKNGINIVNKSPCVIKNRNEDRAKLLFGKA